MRRFYDLRTRLILSHLLVALAGIFLLGGLSVHFIYKEAYHNLEHTLDGVVTTVGEVLESELDTMQTLQPEPLQALIEDLLSTRPEIDFALYQPDGSLLLSRGAIRREPAAEREVEIWEALHNEVGKSVDQRKTQSGESMMYSAVRIQHGYQAFGVLQLAAPTQPAVAEAREELLILALACLLASVLVLGFVWLLAETISKPMRALTTTASALAQGELGQRADPDGPHEMRQLAAALNDMAEQTQSNMRELRAFVANASHELRTPLTVMKLRVEALRSGAVNEPRVAQQFLTEIETEIDRLTHMINDLLDLSKMETSHGKQTWRAVNTLEIIQDVHVTFQIRAHNAGLTLELLQNGDNFEVLGSEDHLRRMLNNLIDNAIKFSPEGSLITLAARSDSEHGKVILQVKDNGSGIAPDHLPHIFERFYRVEKTQPRTSPHRGSGLGLAIVKAIIENHGGSIEVESCLGKGTTFSVELPVFSLDRKDISSYAALPGSSFRTASQRSQ